MIESSISQKRPNSRKPPLFAKPDKDPVRAGVKKERNVTSIDDIKRHSLSKIRTFFADFGEGARFGALGLF